MSKNAQIIVFAGSSRKDSFNKKLARNCVEIAQQKNISAEFVDLADYDLPIYNGDYEQQQSFPAKAKQLKDKLLAAQGMIIASPEYNSSITALLKNTIDWVTRNEDKKGDLSAFQGKVAALVSASPGKLGGLRGLVHLRAILSNIGTLVIPQQLAIASAHEAFNDGGHLKDEAQAKLLSDIITTTHDTCTRLTDA